MKVEAIVNEQTFTSGTSSLSFNDFLRERGYQARLREELARWRSTAGRYPRRMRIVSSGTPGHTFSLRNPNARLYSDIETTCRRMSPAWQRTW